METESNRVSQALADGSTDERQCNNAATSYMRLQPFRFPEYIVFLTLSLALVLRWVNLWAEMGVGLGAEMGIETCALGFDHVVIVRVQLISLDMSSLLGGTKFRGEFINEIHTVVATGAITVDKGGSNLHQFLKELHNHHELKVKDEKTLLFGEMPVIVFGIRYMDYVLGYEKEKIKCCEIKHKSPKQASSQRHHHKVWYTLITGLNPRSDEQLSVDRATVKGVRRTLTRHILYQMEASAGKEFQEVNSEWKQLHVKTSRRKKANHMLPMFLSYVVYI
nr:hypothetical protein [Tanacetum cinerariifolium]